MLSAFLGRSVLLGIVVSLLLSSCKKDRDDNGGNPPPADSSYVLMNTGYVWNSSAQEYNACYWLDEKFSLLTAADAASSYAYGLESVGSDRFIAGIYTKANEPDI